VEEVTLKGYLNQEENKGNLIRIKTHVKREYEIAAVLNKIRNKIVLFENVEGSNFKVVGNVCGERKRLLEAIATTEDEYHNYIYNAMENPLPCEIVNGPYFKVEESISVADLPITKHYESEKNYYITSGIVIARDKEKGFQNSSIHRLMLLDEETFAIRIVPRHLYAMLQEAKKRKEVLIENKEMRDEEVERMLKIFKENPISKILLAVQGGKISEGEDFPSNTIKVLFLVGIPFEQPSPILKEKISYFENKWPTKGKDFAFIIPALRKSIQSIGRSLRDDKSTIFVIFLDKRFLYRNVFKYIPEWLKREMRVLSYSKGKLRRILS